MADIVVTGDTVVAVHPDTWHLLSVPEKLAYVDKTTLKLTDTGSFYSEGELVNFNFQGGKVESIVYNGTTMWPAAEWAKKQSERKRVG